jgi:hypothetical protein
LRISADTSIGVSGRCDFTSAHCRSSARPKTRCGNPRPSLPASRVVTIARNAPLVEAGCADKITISEKAQEIYFYQKASIGEFGASVAGNSLAFALAGKARVVSRGRHAPRRRGIQYAETAVSPLASVSTGSSAFADDDSGGATDAGSSVWHVRSLR